MHPSIRDARSPRRRRAALAACGLAGVLLALAPVHEADARRPKVKRKGGQAEITFGGSLCIPGVASCSSSTDVVGKTGPSLGGGFLIGYRPIRSLLIGGAYNVGFFNPDYRLESGDIDHLYRIAYQNSLFGVIRGILPLWRFDLGIDLAPGWSRQTFKLSGDGQLRELDDVGEVTVNKEYSQGFALKTAPVIDIYITRNIFLGAKFDFIWNFHGEVCYEYNDGSRKTCYRRQETNQASVHQLIIGAHIGGTF